MKLLSAHPTVGMCLSIIWLLHINGPLHGQHSTANASSFMLSADVGSWTHLFY